MRYEERSRQRSRHLNAALESLGRIEFDSTSDENYRAVCAMRVIAGSLMGAPPFVPVSVADADAVHAFMRALFPEE